MRPRIPAPLVLFALALAGAGFDLDAFRHAHGDWQRHLKGHALAAVEGPAACDRMAHWDRAHRDRHPACSACTLAATPADCAAPLPAAARLAVSPPGRPRLSSPPRARLAFSPGAGRAPPPPPLPALA